MFAYVQDTIGRQPAKNEDNMLSVRNPKWATNFLRNHVGFANKYTCVMPGVKRRSLRVLSQGPRRGLLVGNEYSLFYMVFCADLLTYGHNGLYIQQHFYEPTIL